MKSIWIFFQKFDGWLTTYSSVRLHLVSQRSKINWDSIYCDDIQCKLDIPQELVSHNFNSKTNLQYTREKFSTVYLQHAIHGDHIHGDYSDQWSRDHHTYLMHNNILFMTFGKVGYILYSYDQIFSQLQIHFNFHYEIIIQLSK